MKKNIKVLIIACFMFLGITSVKANSISDIKMDIYVDKDGNGHVTETWNATLNEGTEGYRYYGNLGNSEIEDYSVKDETRKYTNIYNWDIDASFDEKSYKSGIYDAGDHKELCFGISKYGTHTYTLSYTITGFVAETDDSQIIYWELLPSALAKLANNASITIHADEKFSDSLDVWGYGNNGGLAYVYDGKVELSNDSLLSYEYMTVLVKFDKGTFNTSNYVGNDFDHYYKMAENGAEHYVDKSSGNKKDNFIGIFFILFYLIITISVLGVISSEAKNSTLKSGSKIMNYGKTGRKIPKNIPMFRDIPYNNDIYRAYWVASNYNLMKKKTDFLGAILLKWLKEDKIKIESKTVGTLFKKEDTTIVFNGKDCNLETDLETKLYNYMYEASKDGILESKEFEKWCSSHYSKILNWFDDILNYENNILIKENKLTKKIITKLKIIKTTVYEVDPSMMEEAKKMSGLKTFFNKFDNMSDKEAIEVKFWQEYLMYAQMFGVAEKVAKQFKKLYPDVITDYSYQSVVFVRTISYSGMSSAQSAKSRAQSYSSGGGGFSSGGGGGGSFGGGGGGGFR